MIMRGKYYFLSNMYPCKVSYNGHVFDCSEAAFQAQKDLSKVSAFENVDGYEAKRLGGRRAKFVNLRPDWEKVKVDIMRDVLRAKFSDVTLAQMLMSVEGEIAEDNDHGDRIWGRVDGVGQNLLGKLLMEVRDEKIKEKNAMAKYVNLDNLYEALQILSKMDEVDLGDIAKDIDDQGYNVVTHKIIPASEFESQEQGCDYYDERYSLTYVLNELKEGRIIDMISNKKFDEYDNGCPIGRYKDLPGVEEIIAVYSSIPEKAWNKWMDNPVNGRGYAKELHDSIQTAFYDAVVTVYDAIKDNKEFMQEFKNKPDFDECYHKLLVTYDFITGSSESEQFESENAPLSKDGRPTVEIKNFYDGDVINGRPTVTIGSGYKCHVNVGNYVSDKLAMYIQLVVAEDNEELDTFKGEPYGVCSVNLGNYSSELSFVQLNSTYLDTNNWLEGDLENVCKALGGKPYIRFGFPVMGHSGFCEYPLYEFDSDKLKAFDSKGYAEYVEAWQKECAIEQDKMNERMFGLPRRTKAVEDRPLPNTDDGDRQDQFNDVSK